VETYQLEDEERIALSLPGGGRITIPLELVDRIVDEEYERPVSGEDMEEQRLASATDARSRRSVRAFEENLPVVSLYSKEILDAAKIHRVDPTLIAAVIKAESNFDPSAISRKGARGLMQLMPATARRLGVSRAFDPRENIRGGTAYLAELADRYGETAVELILAAYNAGERAVEEFGGIPPYRETRAYVKRVTALWNDARAARPAS
jgi:soluble lytic murein transglycosylase-like protein